MSLILGVVLLLIGSTASAQVQRCKFHRWIGATNEDATISWIGTGFEADMKNSRIRKIFYSKKSKWIKVDVKSTSKFTSYNYNSKGKDENRKESEMRYGYRVYKNGKCKAHVTIIGFAPMNATGRVE